MSLTPTLTKDRKRAKHERCSRPAVGRGAYYTQDNGSFLGRISFPFFFLKQPGERKTRAISNHLTSSIDMSSSKVTLALLNDFDLYNDTYIAFMNIGNGTKSKKSRKRRQADCKPVR